MRSALQWNDLYSNKNTKGFIRENSDEGNLLMVDVFSTWSDGRPYGNRELCWVDTVTREWGKAVI